jgi:hypothetical protein
LSADPPAPVPPTRPASVGCRGAGSIWATVESHDREGHGHKEPDSEQGIPDVVVPVKR